uniref:Uncharacterized protein n=1 Tax=Kalanchoe fedtschenkoi TaxID=63787 RepID=A0A7N0URH2_KALFE
MPRSRSARRVQGQPVASITTLPVKLNGSAIHATPPRSRSQPIEGLLCSRLTCRVVHALNTIVSLDSRKP